MLGSSWDGDCPLMVAYRPTVSLKCYAYFLLQSVHCIIILHVQYADRCNDNAISLHLPPEIIYTQICHVVCIVFVIHPHLSGWEKECGVNYVWLLLNAIFFLPHETRGKLMCCYPRARKVLDDLQWLRYFGK